MGILRTLLAIAVVFAHSPFHHSYVFVGGRNAVQLFYMVSGFLISYILHKTPAYRNNTLTFYKSRALRIYPIYYVVAIFTVIATCLQHIEIVDFFRAAPAPAKILVVVSNLLLFGQDVVMFTAIHGGQLSFSWNHAITEVRVNSGLLVPQAWTLGLELTFYLLAPFVLLKRDRVIALLAVSLALRVAFIVVHPEYAGRDPWTYRFFPFELSLFLLGALSQQIILPLWQRHRSGARLSRYTTAAFAGVCAVYFLFAASNNFLASAVLFGSFFFILPATFLFQNQYRLDQKIGELSYPIYIGHHFVILMADPYTRLFTHGALVRALVDVVLSVGFAILLNECVARPIERYRERLKKEPVLMTSAIR